MNNIPLLTREKIDNYLKFRQQPDDFVFAGEMLAHCWIAITNAPEFESKSKYIQGALDNIFSGIDWNIGFNTPMVILTNEDISTEIIIELHYWLRSKSTNIENIHLVTTSQTGTEEWWANWKSCMHQRSFSITDALFDLPLYSFYIDEVVLPGADTMISEIKKHVNKRFSYFGGSYQKDERDYLCLMLASDFYHDSIIDYHGSFKSKQHILNRAEYVSYFCDQYTVKKISQTYDLYVRQNKIIANHDNLIDQFPFQQNEPIDFSGLQWAIDRQCAFSIVRESSMDDVLSAVSEKTFRAFIHWKMVIPVGYKSVDYLKKFGFWFPEEIFDYSYQYEKDWHTRVKRIKDSVKKNIQEYTTSDLINFIQVNQDSFLKNASLVKSLGINRSIPLL